MKKSVYELILKRRTIRRFQQEPIQFEALQRLIDAARVAPSASNLQPLQYIVVDDGNLLPEVFSTLRWAGYIAPRGTPLEGERPTAYIVVLVNKEISSPEYPRDVGAAVENILLAALEEGIGSCCIRSVDTKKLREILNVPEFLEIDSVVALGYSAESPVLEETGGPIKYWKDESGTLHVPKRKLRDILHRNKF